MKTSRILVAGLILSITALSAIGAEATQKPQKKVKAVKRAVNDLPPEVKATLLMQVGDGKIVEVKQKTKKGLVVFHADVLTNGKDWEIDVVADGTLLKNRGKKGANDSGKVPGKDCPDDCGDVPGKDCPDDCGDVPGTRCVDDCNGGTRKR